MASKRRRAGARTVIGLAIGLLVSGVGIPRAVLSSGESAATKPAESPMPMSTAEPGATPAGKDPKGTKDKVQGPAVDDVQEIMQVLNQRKEFLARKEEALREAEARLAILKADAEKILERYEKVTKVAIERQEEQAKKKVQAQVDLRKASVGQAVRMFESMPPEEAASRIDKMPEKAALELLRELKPKTAGAVLAQMKPDRAAKLAEKFLGPVARESAAPN